MNQFYRARHMGTRRLGQKLAGWEEVYTIGYRPWVIGQTLPETGSGLFAALPYDPDYWYADPLLFEYNDESWLFCEAYDRRTAKGALAVARFENGLLQKPQIILREHCHLSFPTVFSWGGEILMVPETGEAHSLCLYRCEEFPTRWAPVAELYTGRELCDAILLNKTKTAVTLLCSETNPENQLQVRWQRYTLTHPRAGYLFTPDEEFNEAQEFNLADRNAGPLCVVQDRVLHPTQYSTDIDYGVGLRFFVRRGRVESLLRTIGPQAVSVMGVPQADRVGVHTYCHDSRWEIVDMRYALPSPQKHQRALARRNNPPAPQAPGPGHSIRFAILQIYCGASGKFGQYNCQEVGFAKALADLGHTCLIVYPDPECTQEKKEALCPGVDVLWVPAKALSVHAFYKLDFLLKEQIQVVQLLADNHLFAPQVHRFCKKQGILCYNYVGALYSDNPDKRKRFVMNLLVRRNLAWFARTLTFAKTPALAEELRAAGVADPPVAPVALDTSIIPPITDSRTKLRRQLGLPLRAKLILYVGRLDPYKHPMALPGLLLALPAEYKLVVIGEGSQAAQLTERMAELELTERFFHIPALPNEQVHAYYHACNAFVNLNSHEIFGMSILEAMYAGCAVAARHAPGPDLIITDGETGFLAEEDSQLPELLQKICTTPALGLAARRDVLTRFTWQHTAQLVLDALQQPAPTALLPAPAPEPPALPATPAPSPEDEEDEEDPGLPDPVQEAEEARADKARPGRADFALLENTAEIKMQAAAAAPPPEEPEKPKPKRAPRKPRQPKPEEPKLEEPAAQEQEEQDG